MAQTKREKLIQAKLNGLKQSNKIKSHCFNCGLSKSECECHGTDGMKYKKCNCVKYGDKLGEKRRR